MKNRLSQVKEPKRFDFVLIGIILCMGVISLVSIYYAQPLLNSVLRAENLVNKQLIWYIIGFIALFFVMKIGNNSLYELAKIAYWILLALLFILAINQFIVSPLFHRNLPFIEPVNGATSWYQFPGIGSLQPSEFIKIDLLIICAYIINQHNEDKVGESFESDIELFIKVIKWCIPPIILILIQPDTGIVLIIVFSIALMLICSGIRSNWLWIGLSVLAVVIVAFFILYFYFPQVFGSSGYKLARIEGWLYPEKTQAYEGLQLFRALLAIGSSGFLGVGTPQVLVVYPEAQTDFIFAVFSQGFGFIGGFLIIVFCLFLDFKLYHIAKLSKINFEKYYIIGLLGILFFQQIENISMILGLLPITGITLPFISYGGSSLLSYFIALGIVMNASAKAKKLSDYIY